MGRTGVTSVAPSEARIDGLALHREDRERTYLDAAEASTLPGPDSTIVIGPLVKHYTYDGFGRLIRTPSPSPWPEPDVEATDIRSERFYYTASGASRKYCL